MLGSSFLRLSDEVLHRELIWVLVCLDHVVPLPEGAFIEDVVARHVSSPPRRIELGEVETLYLHVCNAAEHSEMVCRWLLVV